MTTRNAALVNIGSGMREGLGTVRVPRSLAVWGLLTLLAVQLGVVWWLPYLSFQDLPLHLETTRILQDHVFGIDSELSRAFAVDVGLDPNGLVYLPLVFLSAFFGPTAAGKIVCSLYLILFPWAVLYAVRSIRPDAGYWLYGAFALAWSFPFVLGFLNFCWALVAALFAFGYWARWRGKIGFWSGSALAGVLLITVFLHPIPALFAVWLAMACTVARCWRERKLDSRVGVLTAAILPALLVIAVFVLGSPSDTTSSLSLPTLGVHLITFNPLVSFRLWERIPATLFALGILIAAVAGLRRPGTADSDGLLLALLGLAEVYFLAPAEMAGGGYLNLRVLLCIGLAAVLWLASRPALDAYRKPVVAGGLLVAATLIALQIPVLSALGRQVDDLASTASSIPEGASVATLSWNHRGVTDDGEAVSRRVAPLLHAVGYASADRRLVDLGNYHAFQSYFPIRYRDSCDPFESFWRSDLSEQPPRIDLPRWEARGCRADYLIVWGRGDEPLPRDVAERYERIRRSTSGSTELYRRRSAESFGRNSEVSTEATQWWPVRFQ